VRRVIEPTAGGAASTHRPIDELILMRPVAPSQAVHYELAQDHVHLHDDLGGRFFAPAARDRRANVAFREPHIGHVIPPHARNLPRHQGVTHFRGQQTECGLQVIDVLNHAVPQAALPE
jgi:hypothetical protein